MRYKLILLRKKKNLSQQQVAEYVGISREAYTMIENGSRNPSYKTLMKIKNFYEVVDDSIFVNS